MIVPGILTKVSEFLPLPTGISDNRQLMARVITAAPPTKIPNSSRLQHMSFFRSFSTLVARFTKVADLQLDPRLIKAVTKAGFTELTPVQEKTVVPALENSGVVARAKTGTGKTLAFVLPTVNELLLNKNRRGVSTLVIAPTRDLAMQIEEEYQKVVSKLPRLAGVTTTMMTGGKPTYFNPQRPPLIVIATPGRLADMLSKLPVAEAFKNLQYRVYDEADRLLEQGFEDELLDIESKIPTTDYKLMLFSATIDTRVDRFATKAIGPGYTYINCVAEDDTEAHENIHQTLVLSEDIAQLYEKALSQIIRGLERPDFKAILFVPTKAAVLMLELMFELAQMHRLYDTDLVHRTYRSQILLLLSALNQAKRDRVVKKFKAAKHGLLIATDVAARGMDFTGISDVYMVSPSNQVADYVHKIGRTARAGTLGRAWLFLSQNERRYVLALQRERGISFKEELKGEEIETIPDLWENIAISEAETVDNFINSALSAERQSILSFKMNAERLMPEIVGLYRKIVNNPEARFNISDRTYQQTVQIRGDIANQFFSLNGRGFGIRRDNNLKYQKRKTFDNYHARGSYSKRLDKFQNRSPRLSRKWDDF